LRNIITHGKDWVLEFEEIEKKRLKISSGLKVSFNRVLGYFIQITDNAVKDLKIPEDYVQRQTVKGGVRFETSKLKEMETKILTADDSIKDIEYKIFQEIRAEVQKATIGIQTNAEILAMMDVYSTLAEIAVNFQYTRPIIATHERIIIRQGRHPVIERILKKEPFVPNDVLLNKESDQILLITGPNWSGKSTYLRQVALIVVMAQIGSFVPANSAEIGIVDRVFTRIGASDDLARGQSTFMLEMNETAQILHYATPKSLIIIDELGRGTGTADGQAICQAVIEFLHDSSIKTLFSTHFHQLITLKLPRLHNYHFKIIENTDTRKLIFLRQLVDGGTDKSYGIHVAMMAGLPSWVIDRGFDLLNQTLANGLNSLRPHSPVIYSPLIQSSVNNSSGPSSIIQSSEPSSINQSPLKHSSLSQTPHNDSSTEQISIENSNCLSETFSPPNPSLSKNSLQKNIKDGKEKRRIQSSLFPVVKFDDSEIVIMLRSIDLDSLTPIQAFDALRKLKEKIKLLKKRD
jgi:DNA mismatch repair protein MutS